MKHPRHHSAKTPGSSKRRVHDHDSKHGSSLLGNPGTATVPLACIQPEERREKLEPSPLQDTGLRILGEIIATLEQARDQHKTDLDLQIQRLKTIQHFAAKASETSQAIAPKQRTPHVVGGFLVV